MQITDYTQMPARDFPGIEGVNIRWMLGKKDGAPNFALRIIEVEPGHNTPFHSHDYEHEVYIMNGSGYLRDVEGNEHAFQPGAVIFVEPNEEHGFYNTSDETLRFICVVPHVDGLEPVDELQAAGKVC